jgi:hypothetical protein
MQHHNLWTGSSNSCFHSLNTKILLYWIEVWTPRSSHAVAAQGRQWRMVTTAVASLDGMAPDRHILQLKYLSVRKRV